MGPIEAFPRNGLLHSTIPYNRIGLWSVQIQTCDIIQTAPDRGG